MRVRLTFHDDKTSDYDAPHGVQFLLDDLAVRTGYDLRPCLKVPPEILPDPAVVPTPPVQLSTGHPSTEVPSEKSP